MIVLDTNALIWWISDLGKLSGKTKRVVEEAEKKKAIYISSISVLEILTLIKKQRLNINTLTNNWLDKLENLSYVHFVPVDNKIAAWSVELVDLPDKDPADRIIIATALNLGAKLVTSDKEILNYPKIATIW